MNDMKLLLSFTAVMAFAPFASADGTFEIKAPNMFSAEDQSLPSVSMETITGIDAESVIVSDGTVKEAASRNNVEQLAQLLTTQKASIQVQAAKALGDVSSHKDAAQTVLQTFLTKSQTANHTEFGDQLFSRLAVESAASTSLARLQSSRWHSCAAALFVALVTVWFVYRRSKIIRVSS